MPEAPKILKMSHDRFPEAGTDGLIDVREDQLAEFQAAGWKIAEDGETPKAKTPKAKT